METSQLVTDNPYWTDPDGQHWFIDLEKSTMTELMGNERTFEFRQTALGVWQFRKLVINEDGKLFYDAWWGMHPKYVEAWEEFIDRVTNENI